MALFDTDLHTIKLSDDGSYTAYSKEYNEHYHSTKDGALYESLQKHIIPSFEILKDKTQINILDICFGLGFNTLATIYYSKQNNLNIKLNIYSPELDKELITSLDKFTYPKEFEELQDIVIALIDDGVYKDEQLYIELFLGDAREFIKRFQHKFDVVYQDAFSPSSNPILWTYEYFKDIKELLKDDGILTTYSISLPTRIALYENNFYIYLNEKDGIRTSTIASLKPLQNLELVDIKHKIRCNPNICSLRDMDIKK